MTEEPTKPPAAGETGPVAGERLAEARRARGISLEEVARELRIDEVKVRALEQNAFDHLGAPVFVKGYLRKYSMLVGVSGEDVLSDYERLNHSSIAPPVIGFRSRPAQDISLGPWLGGAAAIAVVGLAAWWFMSTDFESLTSDIMPGELSPAGEEREPASDSSEEPLREVADPAETSTGTTAAPDAPDDTAGAAPQTAPPAVEQPPPGDDDRPPAAGETALRLTYSGDCWTEVTDADGQRLYFGLGTDGRSVAVSGVPPLEVLLGNSENVRVEVDGARYAIPGSARRGDTARFTISP